MKLFVCLFLIVMVIEEYNCAPYRRMQGHRFLSNGRPRHHSPSSRHRSYPGYGPYPRFHTWDMGHIQDMGYQPTYNSYHPWRNTRHCTWHGSRHSARHCSGYGHPRWSQFCYRYGLHHGIHFGKHRHVNTTPMDKTENHFLTVEKPINNVVEKTSEGSMQPASQTSDMPVEIPVGMPTEKLDLVPMTTTGMLVETPTEKSTPAITMTASEPVTITEDKPQDLNVEKPLDKLAKTKEEDAREKLQLIEVTTEKIIENFTEEPVVILVEKATEIPTKELEVNPTEKIQEMPVDKSMEMSAQTMTAAAVEAATMPDPGDKPQVLTIKELLDKVIENPTEHNLETFLSNFDNSLSEQSTVDALMPIDWRADLEGLSDISDKSLYSLLPPESNQF